MNKLAEEAQERVKRAREIAAYFEGDEHLHRLGMAAVFLFEDIAFTLSDLVNDPIREDGEEPTSAL